MMTTYFFDDEPITWDVIAFLFFFAGIMAALAIVIVPTTILWDWVSKEPETNRKRFAPYTGICIAGISLYLMFIHQAPAILEVVRWSLYFFGTGLVITTVYACRNNTPRPAAIVMVGGLLTEVTLLSCYQAALLRPESAYLLGLLTLIFLLYAPWAQIYFGDQPKPATITIP